jgi:hypothetical protein
MKAQGIFSRMDVLSSHYRVFLEERKVRFLVRQCTGISMILVVIVAMRIK